jgi:hypothetical protein
MVRELQWVAFGGAASRVRTITASTSRVGDLARGARLGLLLQTVEPALDEAPTPLADRRLVDPEVRGDLLVLRPGRARQHDPRPRRERLRRAAPPGHRLERQLLLIGQLDLRRATSHGPAPICEFRARIIPHTYEPGH